LMEQLGIDARSAYVRLQAFAFGNRQSLKDIARDVVSRRLRSDPESGETTTPHPTAQP
jgi:hypothetical protein